MPAASSDDARGASPAASVLAPSEGETEDPRISAYDSKLQVLSWDSARACAQRYAREHRMTGISSLM